MAISISGTSGISQTGSFDSASTFGFKNRIINGAMVIDQRNAGAAVSATGQYTLDRWVTATSVGSKFTVGQNAGSVTSPTGFGTYLGVTSSSAYSVPAGEIYAVAQYIEGVNFYDLAWGTASAATVTLSFWVRSSLTGTFGGALQNSAQNRSYPFSYTISAANTWEQKTVTIAGDTTGTWVGVNTGVGVRLFFSVGTGTTYSGTAGSWSGNQYYSVTGATSVVGTNAATFYITGVQLEKGSTATSFDYRPYGTELFLCQRYYFQYQTASNDTQEVVSRGALTGFDLVTYLPVTMRAAPTLILPSGSTYGRLVAYDSAFAVTAVNVTALTVQASNQSLSAIHLGGTNASLTFAQGQAATSFDTNNISVGLGLSAEL